MLMGRISSQIKMSFLKTKADLRLNNIYLPKGMESVYQQSEKLIKAQRISQLTSKLKAGLQLSSIELAFLRDNSPGLYAKAIQIMKERDEYRKQLAKCKTKDEVQKVHTGKLQELASTAQQISSSDMDAGAKLDALEYVQMRTAGIVNEQVSFLATPEYKRLPWEHEKQRKRKERTIQLVSNRDRLLLREAEERARRLRAARAESNDSTTGRKKDVADFGSFDRTRGKSTADSSANPAAAIYNALALPAATRSASPDAGRVASPDAERVASPDAGRVASPDAGRVASPDARRVASPDAGRVASLETRAVNRPVTPKGMARRGKISILT